MLQTRLMNGWPLFSLLSALISASTIVELLNRDLGKPDDVAHMIAFSVRWAVPLIYIVIAASSMPVLFPGAFSKWWMRNRRYLGLVFAVAMAWQGAFIFILSALHTDYYYSDIYLLRDELEGSSGYLFLALMVLTSFRSSRQYLTPGQWKLLHKSGVYFLWAYPFSVYWWNVFYYADAKAIDYLFYCAGFVAFALRILAWGKRRRQAALRSDAHVGATPVMAGSGMLLITAGLVAAATGDYWQAATTRFLTAPDWSANLVLWFPFWPFEPFLPLLAMAAGMLCVTSSRDWRQSVMAAGSRPEST